MKLLIFTILFLANSAMAGWVSQSDIVAYKADQTSGVDYYSKKGFCESKEAGPCLKHKKNYRRWMIGQIEDRTKPQYVKQDIEVCLDLASCQPLLEAKDCSAYPEGSFAVMLEDLTEVYCADFTGYGTKDALVPDDAERAAITAEKAQKAADKAVRQAASADKQAQLSTCLTLTAGRTGSLTGPQTKKCIWAIIRELMKDRVPVSEL